MMVNGSEFRLIQLPCFLLTAQFNSLHSWTGRNSSQLGTPQVSFHWPRTTNSQCSECTEHIITVSREFSCNNCTEFVVGLKVLLHYSINVSHRCQCYTGFRLCDLLPNQLLLLLKNIPLNSFLKLCKTQTGTLSGNVQKNDPLEGTISKGNFCCQSWWQSRLITNLYTYDITQYRYYIHKLTYKVLY